MDRLDWEEDEIATRLRGKASVRGPRIRIVGHGAADDEIETRPRHEQHIKIEPAHVHSDDEQSREVEVCALVPFEKSTQPLPRAAVELALDEFLEDWELDRTDRMSTDPAVTRPRGSPPQPVMLDVSSRHAPFEEWPEDPALGPLKLAQGEWKPEDPLAHAYTPPPDDDVPGLPSPDSWVPQQGSAWQPKRPGGTLSPTVMPRIQRAARRAGPWLTVSLVALALAVGAWLWPRPGTLRVELAEHSSVPEVDVYVDGALRCQTTPCIVRDLEARSHLVKVVAPGKPAAAPETFTVLAGEETLATLSIPVGDAPLVGQGITLASSQRDVRVEVDGRERGTLPLSLADLSVGEHRLRFVAPDHRPLERRVNVKAGEVTALKIELDALPPRILVELDPSDASVQIRRKGEGYKVTHPGGWPRTLELASGEWELVAFRRGFRPLKQQLVLKDGVQTIRLKLQPILSDPNDIYWP